MALADFAFLYPLRVRWAETDMVGVVFNGHYAAYFHVAFTEYLRATGLPNALEQGASGHVLYVRKSTIEYAAPARFDDLLEIGFRCAAIGRSSIRFVQEIFRDGQHLISGELTYVYADTQLGKGVAVPDDWRRTITSFEKLPPDTL
jgi:acyl-CoA thioester hydrolase